jgi:hypothetical protein
MYDFKQVTSSSKFLSYKDWDINDYVVGKILNFKANSKNPKVQDVIVSILDSNIKKDKVVLSVNDAFTINGTTALQKALDNSDVEEGQIIKVVYLGKESVKTGAWKGTMANKLDVFIAKPSEASPSNPITDDEVL